MSKNDEYIQMSEKDNEQVKVAVHLLLKTLSINNIPEYIGMVALGKGMLVVAEYHHFDDEDLRHLFSQFYKLYLEATRNEI